MGGASTSGAMPDGGGPTNTVNDRTTLPARSVRTATPLPTAWMVRSAVRWPGCIALTVAVATAGLLDVTLTSSGTVPSSGSLRSCTAIVDCWAAAVNACPAEGGVEIERPAGAESADTCCPATGSLTETVATASPRADRAITAVLPAALPASTGSHGHEVQAVTSTVTLV